jgi:hydrogenase expression/formation protein HypE
MTRREGLTFESEIKSDTAALWPLVKDMLGVCPQLHCLRDPTRGGVTAAVCDIAGASNVGIRINESALPVRREVSAACRLLGLDPLNVANEGKAIVVCPAADAEAVLDAARANLLGRGAAVIGDVVADHPGMAVLRTGIGGERILTPSTGEDLPRIC